MDDENITMPASLGFDIASSHGPHVRGLLALSSMGDVLSPVVMLVLCVVAGFGTFLLLPGRKTINLHRLGGAILFVAAMVFAGLIIRLEAGSGGAIARIYFWIFSGLALFSAVRVVTHPRPVYSALYFVLTVFSSAGLFVLMEAEFMAAALVLIYAGAILITYVFVIMLASQASTGDSPSAAAAMTEYDTVSREPLAAAAVGFALAFVLLFVIFDRANHILPAGPPQFVTIHPHVTGSDAESPSDAPVEVHGNTQELGMFLFRNQLAQLDVAGLMLTIAMVGAIVISRRQVMVSNVNPMGSFSRADIVVAPATPVDDNPHSIPVYGTDNPRQKAYPQT